MHLANQIKTYRYLRIGMIMVMALLAVSIIYEVRANTPDCLRTSISAYYHTPAQSIFVGALVAVGACLVIIRGFDDLEDIALNLAGMLALIVAMVPVRPPDECVSTLVISANDATANIANNVVALCIVGSFSVAWALLILRDSWPLLTVKGRVIRGAGVAAAALLVAGTWLWYQAYPASFAGEGRFTAHYVAAVSMFVLIAIVVGLNARPRAEIVVRDGYSRSEGYRRIYFWVFVAMVLIGLALIVIKATDLWDHVVFVAEAAAIASFVIFWATQTGEVRRLQ